MRGATVGGGGRGYMRTWNLPALVRYLTPLKGLYFSPYMSRRLTFNPETASCEIWNCTLIDGFASMLVLPGVMETCKVELMSLLSHYLSLPFLLTVPRMLGNLETSMRPTSQESVLLTESNVYLP